MDARMLVIDADAHINEPVVRLDAPDDELAPWRALAEKHPGWQRAGQSGGKTVSLIEGKLFPTQEGPGRGVPIESAMHPQAADGALHLDARIRDLDKEGIDVQVLYGGLSIGATTSTSAGWSPRPGSPGRGCSPPPPAIGGAGTPRASSGSRCATSMVTRERRPPRSGRSGRSSSRSAAPEAL